MKYCVLDEGGKFGTKNIPTLHRYRDFRVVIFQFESICVSDGQRTLCVMNYTVSQKKTVPVLFFE